MEKPRKLNDTYKTISRLPGFLALAPLLFLAQAGQAQPTLQAQMAQIAVATHGPVGAAVVVAEGGKIVSLNGEQKFPMQSVYKLPIAMAVLHQVDLGKLSLNQKANIDTRSSNGAPTVAKPLDKMITVSDNASCDALLKMVGGPKAVTAYLRGLGVHNMVVATSEATMARNEDVEQYRNWATPNAMAGLLSVLQQGKGLAPNSRRLLLTLMTKSATGLHRIRGLLPPGTTVAHKTGSSGTVGGLTRATNDAGTVTLPDGRHLIVVVFVSDTRADIPTQEAVIAKITRAAWDRRKELEIRR